MLRTAVGAALAVGLVLALGRVGVGPEGTGAQAAPAQGAQLAVVRLGRRSAILVLDVGTGKSRELHTRVRAASFDSVAWSPDGAAIAFAGVVGGEHARDLTDIFVVASDGSGLRRLTQTGRASSPLWSPDGSTVVFTVGAGADPFPRTATLWSIGVSGGGPRELTRADGLTADLAGSFAPDGSRLLFTRVREPLLQDELAASIYVLDLATGGIERLLDRAALPAYSPDGKRIAYVSDVDENGSLSYGEQTSYATELYVMNADGSDRRRLTQTRDLDEWTPSWSPDGNVIAFVRGKQFENAEGYAVMGMTEDGTCARFLAADPSFGTWYGSPAWRPGTAGTERCPPARPGAGILRNDFALELRRARAFRGYPLYWAGERTADLYLAEISAQPSRGPGGMATTYTFFYRNCRLAHEGSGCAGFQLQHWPACARVPADVDLPNDGTVRIRGVDGVFFAGGSQLEIVTGKTTLVIFASGRAAALRAARTLRGLNVRVGARDAFPKPAPGVLLRGNRCR